MDVERAALPWFFIMRGRRQGWPTLSRVWPDGVGPQVSVVRNWGRAQGLTGELKIKPVCSHSLGGSPGVARGDRRAAVFPGCVGIWLHFAPLGASEMPSALWLKGSLIKPSVPS